jgi:hypothetical protein
MKKIKMMDLTIRGVVLRFYMMMAGTIILGFSGQFFIAAIWAFTLSVSFILGVSFKTKQEPEEKMKAKVIPLRDKKEMQDVG